MAEELLASLDPHVAEVDVAWDAELKQRIAQIEQNSVQLVPLDEGLAKVRRTLGP